MTALNNNKETSINPMIIMDKAIDMSTHLSGSQFPVSIFPAKIQRIIKYRSLRLDPSHIPSC